MSRLTHKDFDGNYYSYTTQGNYIEGYFTRENKEWFYGNVVNKLGKLEDIEQELGCPLEVVFKAIEDGIVIKGDINQYGAKTLWLDNKPLEALVGEKLDFEEPRLIKYNEWCFSCYGGSYRGCVSLKDYKVTWWMKEEEE